MSQIGKRYRCEVCGSEALCTRAGEGALVCCEKEMKAQEPPAAALIRLGPMGLSLCPSLLS